MIYIHIYTLHLIIITGGLDCSGGRLSEVRQVAQEGGAESRCVESAQPSLLRGVDLDSQTGLDRGGYNYEMRSTYYVYTYIYIHIYVYLYIYLL